jgi:hypothetical protein
MSGWTSADLLDRFQLYLGRGTGGVMEADELWTDARAYMILADAQENVYAELAPIAPHAFVGAPTQLTTADGGVTYTFGADVMPFGHVEIYAQETGGRMLYATTYGNAGGDFVIEGSLIRSPGNRVRSYQTGPWARFTAFPARLSASQEPSLSPAQARELILWKALELATEVSGGQMDPLPWATKYAEAKRRWTITWQTQYQSAGSAALTTPNGPWWLGLDAMNDAGLS